MATGKQAAYAAMAYEDNSGNLYVYAVDAEEGIPVWGALYESGGEAGEPAEAATARFKEIEGGGDPVGGEWGYGGFEDEDDMLESWAFVRKASHAGVTLVAGDDGSAGEARRGHSTEAGRFLAEALAA